MRSQKTGKSTDEDDLAEFADQVLSDDLRGDITVSEDPELARLQKTVLLLHQARGPERPSQEVTEKMKLELAAELRQMQRAERAATPGIDTWRLRQRLASFFFGYRRPQWVFSTAVVMVVILIGFVVLFPPGGANMPGAADGGRLVPVALILCAVLGGLLFWSMRKRP